MFGGHIWLFPCGVVLAMQLTMFAMQWLVLREKDKCYKDLQSIVDRSLNLNSELLEQLDIASRQRDEAVKVLATMGISLEKH